MISKRFLRSGTVLGLAAALGMGTAVAQNIDSDVVEVIAEVVAAMQVTPINSPIDLGQLFGGSTGDVAADGTSTPFSTAARFDVSGASGLTWELSVAYSDLLLGGIGPDAISIAAPVGSQICFNDTVGGQTPCTVTGNSPLSVVEASHTGDGTAWVGFSFAVPALAPAGIYNNPSAIQLTAEGLLGT
jgi:hypothetical protein